MVEFKDEITLVKKQLENALEESFNYKEKVKVERKLVDMNNKRLGLFKQRNKLILDNFNIKNDEKKWDYEDNPEYWAVLKELQKLAFLGEELKMENDINNIVKGIENAEKEIKLYDEIKIPEYKKKLSEMGEKYE